MKVVPFLLEMSLYALLPTPDLSQSGLSCLDCVSRETSFWSVEIRILPLLDSQPLLRKLGGSSSSSIPETNGAFRGKPIHEKRLRQMFLAHRPRTHCALTPGPWQSPFDRANRFLSRLPRRARFPETNRAFLSKDSIGKRLVTPSSRASRRTRPFFGCAPSPLSLDPPRLTRHQRDSRNE